MIAISKPCGDLNGSGAGGSVLWRVDGGGLLVRSVYSTTVALRIRGKWFVTTYRRRVPSLSGSRLIP